MDSVHRYKGTVIWFSPVKGYGFVSVGGQQAFVHYSQIAGEGYRNLTPGDKVEFELVDLGKGPQAINVKVMRG